MDPLSQILILLRFFCFMALFYLAMHKLVARLSQKPGSKLRWFFDVLTQPLTRPVQILFGSSGSHDELLTRSLLFYGLLWLCMVVLGRIMIMPR
jgi:hypothetical protein